MVRTIGPCAEVIPRGALADDWISENNALLAASMGLPFVRGGGAFRLGTGGGGSNAGGYDDGQFSDQYSDRG